MNPAEATLARLTPARATVFQRGTWLFLAGDPVRNIHVVRSGRIKLIRHAEDGRTTVLQVALAGDMLAEASLFSPRHHCSAIVDSATAEVAVFPRQALVEAMRADCDAAMAILELFARRIRKLRALLEIRNIRQADQRILAWLRLEAGETDEVTLTMPLKDVAAQLGLAHETLYRTLKQLEQDGRIIRQNDRIQLRKSV